MIDDGVFFNWGPCLWKTKVNRNLCVELLERSKQPNVRANSYNKYLSANIEEEYGYLPEDLTWFAEKFNPYVELYLTSGQVWYKKLIEKGPLKFNLAHMWTNYMKKGDSSAMHVHEDSNISFVIYLKVPDALKQEQNFSGNYASPGSISFFYGEKLDNFIGSYHFLPEEGDMFMFPSQLRHLVVPFRSDVVRISAAGNLLLEVN